MRRFAYLVLPCLVIALMAGPASKSAYADTYKIYDLGGANANTSFGITDNGTAVVRRSGACDPQNGAEPPTCYYTYVDGIGVSSSETVPDLVFDNGTFCKPAGASDPTSFDTKCNGGYDAFLGGAEGRTFYVGPDGRESILPTHSVIALQLNAVGDAFWTDGAFEEIYEAVDLTPSGTTISPEPSTLLLMGSGLLGVAGTLRRRLVRG